ncbi:MAG TPA: DNA polymerase III subunit chi [Gammaproteobacteria bacterium]
MTEIDFYVLASATPGKRDALACRIAEKAVGLGHRVFVQARDAAHARALDDLLWTFRDGSFLPHSLGVDDADAPVIISAGEEPAGDLQVMINLSNTVPAFFSRFERVAELVDEEPAVRDAGRERFRFYRDRGYSLRTHKL